MHSCNVYLTPQGLPKYIYLSPPLIFPTTHNGIRTRNRPVWITPGTAPIRWMGPIRNPRWEQKRIEGYVIVSMINLSHNVVVNLARAGFNLTLVVIGTVCIYVVINHRSLTFYWNATFLTQKNGFSTEKGKRSVFTIMGRFQTLHFWITYSLYDNN